MTASQVFNKYSHKQKLFIVYNPLTIIAKPLKPNFLPNIWSLIFFHITQFVAKHCLAEINSAWNPLIQSHIQTLYFIFYKHNVFLHVNIFEFQIFLRKPLWILSVYHFSICIPLILRTLKSFWTPEQVTHIPHVSKVFPVYIGNTI